ncbi:hypothetical protein KP509_11G040800 [Ceratopteris richardii]|uniref:DYW domain-containing protein n=1 Tax=Ceratopteris richardii TaxID=49495 RepID=A0A8T2TUM4_CERRI|nr:hypothetical protein KP509_11G040800 [Ceratopteris richardii]
MEIGRRVHEFCVDNKSPVYFSKIAAGITHHKKAAEDEGHVPQLKLVLNGLLSDEEKQDRLWQHSERIALVFGLISTPPGTSVSITKNLQVCADCQSILKFMSKFERKADLCEGYTLCSPIRE